MGARYILLIKYAFLNMTYYQVKISYYIYCNIAHVIGLKIQSGFLCLDFKQTKFKHSIFDNRGDYLGDGKGLKIPQI